MNIVVLDRAAMGQDLDFSCLSKFGDVTIYETSGVKEARERVSESEIILTNKVKINEELMRCAPNLKLVCVFATGFDNIDVNYAQKHGIAVCNIPAYSTESVTLYTIATVLTLATNITPLREHIINGDYSEGTSPNRLNPTYHEIFGKTWGIIGCGNIGSRVAAIAQSFGCRVLTYQRHAHPTFETVSLSTLLKESDIITVHCPLNESTRHLIDAAAIQMMKPNAILVNEARGAVLDESAVADAILNHKIAAFGADVYSVEPFPKAHPFYPIRNFANVCLTPHVAWAAFESRVRALNIVCDNIQSFLNKETKNRVV